MAVPKSCSNPLGQEMTGDLTASETQHDQLHEKRED